MIGFQRTLAKWSRGGALVAVVLLAAVGCVILMIVMNGLPRFYHPCFKSERFLRATDDRFFLVIEARDPKFYQHQTEEFLEALNPISVEALEA